MALTTLELPASPSVDVFNSKVTVSKGVVFLVDAEHKVTRLPEDPSKQTDVYGIGKLFVLGPSAHVLVDDEAPKPPRDRSKKASKSKRKSASKSKASSSKSKASSSRKR